MTQFGNPVVGGTELVRNAIKSSNYLTGVSGWSINRDGTAEFTGGATGAAGSFDTLSANDEFYYKGTKLSDLLSNKPDGVVAFAPSIPGFRSFASAATTHKLMTQLSFTYRAGRRYAILVDPFSWNCNAAGLQVAVSVFYKASSAGNCVTTDPNFQIDFDTSAYSGDSQTLCGKLVDVEWPGSFVDGNNYNLAFSFWTNTAGFTINLPNGTPQFAVYDMGPTPVTNYVDLYSGGGIQPTFHALQEAAFDSQSYMGNGVASWGSGGVGQNLYQGEDVTFPSNGNWRSYALFAAAGGAGTAQLAGVPLSSFTYCDVYLYFYHWYFNAGGSAVIGYTTDTSINHSVEVGGGAYNQFTDSNWPRNAGIWVSLLGMPNVMAAINAGTFHGIILGPGPNTNATYYGFAGGHASPNPPQFRAGWYA